MSNNRIDQPSTRWPDPVINDWSDQMDKHLEDDELVAVRPAGVPTPEPRELDLISPAELAQGIREWQERHPTPQGVLGTVYDESIQAAERLRTAALETLAWIELIPVFGGELAGEYQALVQGADELTERLRARRDKI